MDRILLTGGSGLLGMELQKYRKYLAPSHSEMDITDFSKVKSFIGKNAPELVVHSGAYTDVAAPEKEEREMVKCYITNVRGTRNIVNAIGNTPIIYISTEYVLEPVNFYSLSKLQGENETERAPNHHIIRTSFKPRPFEHPGACTDVWTIGDYVDVIAPLIDKYVRNPKGNLVYIGTGKKNIYDLARQSRPDVMPITRDRLGIQLPSLKDSLDSVRIFEF